MSNPSTLLPPDVRALRRALEQGQGASHDAKHALEDACRARTLLADPLGAYARASVPDPALRASLVSRPEATLPGPPGAPPIRLAADTVSVAVALADDLFINERDAAVLLYNARSLVVRRADRNVGAAAKELYYSRRREVLLFLHEMLRVHLLGGGGEAMGEDADADAEFQMAIGRERDTLFAQCGLFQNILDTLQAGLPSLAMPSSANPRPQPPNRAHFLANDEAVLLAEALFLLAYSVQLSAAEALSVRDLLGKVIALVASIAAEEDASSARVASHNHHHNNHPNTQHQHQGGGRPANAAPNSPHQPSRPPSHVYARAQSVQNLIFLAWICGIDRSRYSDMYDPRTGSSGFNLLLRDHQFTNQICKLPPFNPEEDSAPTSPPLSPAIAAAELGGALFRMAVADPDQDENITTVIRTCATGEALEFLTTDLAVWIEDGAGSLLPDANLYADVFEDFAFDLSEAPAFAKTLFDHTQDELKRFAASTAAFFRRDGLMGDSHAAVPSVGTPGHPSRLSSLPMSGGKPPKPPPPTSSVYGAGVLPSHNPAVSRWNGLGIGTGTVTSGHLLNGVNGEPGDASSTKKPKNLVVLLGELVVRAVRLAPGKLFCDSVGGGRRYWAGVGPDATGFVTRMSQCVVDMHDANFRNAEADTFYEQAYKDSLDIFLKILAITAIPGGNVIHAAESLRHLCHSGDAAVSLDRAQSQLNHFCDAFTSPPSAGVSPVSDSDITILIGLLEILSNCAVSMQSQGGMSPIVGRGTMDLAPRAGTLALQDVPPRLRASLVRSLLALGERRSALMFLGEVAKNKAAKLRQMIRGQEAELGVYDATVAVLELAKESCSWPADEFSSQAVESVAEFAVDEVVSHWSQRTYATDFERWRLVRSAGELVLALVHRDEIQRQSGGEIGLANLIFSKLLCPAPGTGAACPALRALISCVGLRRSSDDGLSSSNATGSHFQTSGREALAQAASIGDGAAVREMELAVTACARALRFTLSLSPSEFSSHLMVTARASDLLLSEPKAIVAAGSLVFAVDDCSSEPSFFRLGYSTSTCGAVLGMLALAASQSTLICRLLTRTDEPAMSFRFRCSLADVISSYSFANSLGGVGDENLVYTVSSPEEEDADDVGDTGADSATLSLDRPRMQSALDLVESCLGMDGSGKPGLFLLGLVIDAGDRLQNAEYGVLSALMELVSGVGQGSYNRVDDRSRAHAAVFLERLAGNTTAVTSSAVLEFVRSVGSSHTGAKETTDGTSSGGFGDAMLSRILSFESSAADDTDWNALGELTSACMKLSALLVRQFPAEEEASFSFIDQRSISLGRSSGPQASVGPPPPDVLLRLCARVAGKGKIDVAVDAFRNWHHLLGARLLVHPLGRGYGAIPLLLDITIGLLNALDSTDLSSDMSLLSSQDGGAQAASVILRCLGHIAQVDTSYSPGPEEVLGDSQAGMLLAKAVRAIAGRAEGRGDVAQTRTSLYAAFLVCCQLAETKSTGGSISQAFSGRMGSRQTNGAEALVAIACEDAISGPAAATRAAALVSLSVAVNLDPLRVLPALSSQNRLRRVVASAVGDPSTQSRIVRSCSRGSVEEDQATSEKAAVVVAESALSLIHAVAAAVDGVRALSDAACLESVASLLEALAAPRHRLYDNENVGRGDTVDRRVGVQGRGRAEGRSRFGDQADSDMEEDGDDMERLDWSGGAEATESPEDRCAGIAGILTAAVAASVVGSDSILVDGALATLHAGESLYARLIRAISRPRRSHWTAVGHLAMVLSRIPERILSDGAVPTQLRSLLACHVGCLVPHVSYESVLGKSGSPLSVGLDVIAPRDAREARRSQTEHPEGGSLFERDLISGRIECLKCVFAALRPPMGLLSFFFPRFAPGTSRQNLRADYDQHGFLDEVSGRQCDLGDILRIAKASLDGMIFYAEESMRLAAVIAEEAPDSVQSRRLADIAPFCAEELDLGDDEDVTGDVALFCIRRAATASRRQADDCVTILESALFILREYTSAASETLRGSNYSARAGEECPLTVLDAEVLLEEAKNLLLPLCRDLDALSAAVWGKQDPSFSRQLGRQIRTNLASSR